MTTTMFVVSKDYTAMATNYKRRLSGTDKFLTTTTNGKRIEVKSDLLTENYNNKIMKNIKELIEEFQNEAKKRIANGEFEVIEVEDSIHSGYIGDITIMIDEVEFQFSISKNEYVCDHSPFRMYPLGTDINEKELNVLKKSLHDFTKEDRDNQIKKLQEKIKELQK